MLFAFSGAAFADDTYGGFEGSGTAADPFLISTPANLLVLVDVSTTTSGVTSAEFKTYQSGYFKLTNDIDMAGYDWHHPMFASNAYRFNGDFDGNGFAILNLSKSTPHAAAMGLFGVVGGKVHDLTLKDIDLLGTGTTGMGGVTGQLAAKGVIDNCTVTGTLTITGTYSGYTGGIVGEATGSGATISNCVFNGNIVANSSTNYYLGGILGYVRSGVLGTYITDSYSAGTISRPGVGPHAIGKILGGAYNTQAMNGTHVIDCTSSMVIDATSQTGEWSGLHGDEVEPPVDPDVIAGLGVYYNDGAVAVKPAERLAVATLWFSATDETPAFSGANNFTVLDNAIDGGLQRVTLGYMVAGGNGFTAASGVILNITGATGLKLEKARFVGYDASGNAGYISYNIVKDDGTGTSGGGVVPPVIPPVVPTNYDLNEDGVVDQLDLAVALKYFMTAQIADFNKDGVVDIEDFILLLNHMTF